MTIVLAELGSNPVARNWNFAPYLDAAKLAGADGVKVQMFYAAHFPAHEQADKAALEFPRYRFGDFVAGAHSRHLQAGASVFDDNAISVTLSAGADFLKLAAREAQNWKLNGAVTNAARDAKLPLYRSVPSVQGAEWQNATAHPLTPDWPRLVTLYAEQAYPAGLGRSLVSLLRWAAYCKRNKMRWGWSSHTIAVSDCMLAAMLGAEVIEKHLCLGTDEIEVGHSLTPERFRAMTKGIRK